MSSSTVPPSRRLFRWLAGAVASAAVLLQACNKDRFEATPTEQILERLKTVNEAMLRETVRPAPVDRGDTPGTDRPLYKMRGVSLMSASAAFASDAQSRGAFGPSFPWAVMPIHVAVLPDGRVMSFGTGADGVQGAQFQYAVWNPALGTNAASMRLLANTTNTDIFCAAQAIVPSTGELLISGNDVTINGERNFSGNALTSYTFRDDAMRPAPSGPMAFKRWYPTLITSATGEMIVMGGQAEKAPFRSAPTPEVVGGGTRRVLTGASSEDVFGTSGNWFYPRAWVAPNSRIFVLGLDGRMWWFDPAGSGSVSLASSARALPTSWDYTAVMYAPGRILSLRYDGRAQDIDITSGSPTIRATTTLSRDRKLATATVLADGRVAVSGGSERWNETVNPSRGIEIWDPATGRWSMNVAATRDRLYHSISLLLPDGSLLTGGGGAPGPMNNLNGEIYYPSYLFRKDGSGTFAPRPVIVTAPKAIAWGSTFTVTLTAGTASRVTLVRLGSATHNLDVDQRFMELPFTAGGDGRSLTITAPANGGIAPPGYYMLFVFDAAGVPSISRIVAVGAGVAAVPEPIGVPTPDMPAATPAPLPASGWRRVGPVSRAIAASPDGTVMTTDLYTGMIRTYVADNSWNDAVGTMAKDVTVRSRDQHLNIGSDDRVYRWNGSTWQAIGPAARTVALAGDGMVLLADPSGSIFKYFGDNDWRRWIGGAKRIAPVTPTRVYYVGLDDRIWFSDGVGERRVGNEPVIDVAASPDGTVLSVGVDGIVRRWRGDFDWPVADDGTGRLKRVAIGAGGRLWGIGMDDQVYAFTPTVAPPPPPPSVWSRVGPAAAAIAAGNDGTVMMIDRTGGQIRQYVADNQWQSLAPTVAKDVTVRSAFQHLHVGSDDRIYRWNGSVRQTIGPAARTVALAGDGTVLLADPSGSIFKYFGDNDWRRWIGMGKRIALVSATRAFYVGMDDRIWYSDGQGERRVGNEPVIDVAASMDGTVLALTSDGSVRRMRGDFDWPVADDGSRRMKRIAVGTNGRVWGIGDDDQIYSFTLSRPAPQTGWVRVGPTATAIAAGSDGTVMMTERQGGLIRRYVADDQWQELPGTVAKDVTVRSRDQNLHIGSDDRIYRWSGSFWQSIGPAARTVALAGDGMVLLADPSGAIFRYFGDNDWRRWIGGAKRIAPVTPTRVYYVGLDDRIWFSDGRGERRVGNEPVVDVAASPDGTVIALGADGVPRRFRADFDWPVADNGSGRLKRVAVGANGRLWGVGTDDQVYVYR